MGGRTVVMTGFAVAMMAVFLVFAAGITALVTAINMSAPPALSSALAVVPTNVSVCLGALQTGVIARWLYNYKLTLMMVIANG